MMPLPVPPVVESVNHGALLLAAHMRVPPPVLLMLNVCTVGVLLPCWAVKDRLVGLAPIAGLIETTGVEGGAINCVNSGISAANLLIDRPPPLPDFEELPPAAADNGIVPVDTVPAALNCMVVVHDGAVLIVYRGAAVPTLLLGDEGSLG
jgi:hypothetical protein